MLGIHQLHELRRQIVSAAVVCHLHRVHAQTVLARRKQTADGGAHGLHVRVGQEQAGLARVFGQEGNAAAVGCRCVCTLELGAQLGRQILRPQGQLGAGVKFGFIDQLRPGGVQIPRVQLPLRHILAPALSHGGQLGLVGRQQREHHAVLVRQGNAWQWPLARHDHGIATKGPVPLVKGTPVDEGAEELALATAQVGLWLNLPVAVEPDILGLELPLGARQRQQADDALDMVSVHMRDHQQLDALVTRRQLADARRKVGPGVQRAAVDQDAARAALVAILDPQRVAVPGWQHLYREEWLGHGHPPATSRTSRQSASP